MNLETILISIVIGGVAGLLSGLIVEGFGFSVVANFAIGILGAGIADFVAPRLGLYLNGDIPGGFISAIVGAVTALVLAGLCQRR